MPWSTTEAHTVLSRYRSTPYYLGLFTSTPDNTGSGGSEAAYGGYARVRVDNKFAAPSGKAMQNNTAIDFAQVATNTGLRARAWGLFDALAGGSLVAWGLLGTLTRAFTASPTGTLITCPGHSFVDGVTVRIVRPDITTLPGGLAEGTTYFVVSSNQPAGTLQLSASEGGAPVAITTAGGGYITGNREIPLNEQTSIQFGVGNFVLVGF
jgi:hypothetical protein